MARKKAAEAEEDIFWVTMSDLFLGMFMVFATLFFAFVTNTGQGGESSMKATQEQTEQVVDTVKGADIKVRIIDENHPEKDYDNGEKYNIEIDQMTGLVRISDMELFDLNSAVISPKGKKFLDLFIPIYFDSIFDGDLEQYVSSVIIQGHTDSTKFKGHYSTEQQYMKNMNLSMNRAYNVANYIFVKSHGKKYSSKLTKIIQVQGLSSSRPLLTLDGKEDKSRSRRVELRLMLKKPADNIIQQLTTYGGNYEDFR